MSGDVVAAIDAALADNTVSPDAMRHTNQRCTLQLFYDGEQVWTREQLAEFQERINSMLERQARAMAIAAVTVDHARHASPDDFALMPPRPEEAPGE